MTANVQFPRLLIQQKNGHRSQVEVILRDRQNPLQNLVRIKGRENRLAGVVQNCDSLHWTHENCRPGSQLLLMPKVTWATSRQGSWQNAQENPSWGSSARIGRVFELPK